ncbi:hypothetical protein AVEN_206444-1, partial [Araneus ventricosus]
VTTNGVTPALPWHPGFLNDGHCNSSSAEAEVLIVVTGHDPNPNVESTYLTNIVPQGQARSFLLIWRLLILILVVPPLEIH